MLKLRVGTALFLTITMLTSLAWAADPATQDHADKTSLSDDFEQRVRDYLLQNPEVIVQTLEVWRECQRTAQVEQVKALIKVRSDETCNDPESPVGGNPEGDVTVVEFFDYNCPYCKQATSVFIQAEQGDPGLRRVYQHPWLDL